jgi:hypothetical protein
LPYQWVRCKLTTGISDSRLDVNMFHRHKILQRHSTVSATDCSLCQDFMSLWASHGHAFLQTLSDQVIRYAASTPTATKKIIIVQKKGKISQHRKDELVSQRQSRHVSSFVSQDHVYLHSPRMSWISGATVANRLVRCSLFYKIRLRKKRSRLQQYHCMLLLKVLGHTDEGG